MVLICSFITTKSRKETKETDLKLLLLSSDCVSLCACCLSFMICSFTLGSADFPSSFLYLSLCVLISLKGLIPEIRQTATDMCWSSSPSIFLPSGSTDEYFGREKQFNQAFTACMWVCSGASVFFFFYFRCYLTMEAGGLTGLPTANQPFGHSVAPLLLMEFHLHPEYVVS